MSTASASRKPRAGGESRPPRSLRLRVHGWLRWLHIYISMFSLLAILFFSLTGIALNHPDWKINNAESRRDLTGSLPADWKKGSEVDWFKVAEYLRAREGVRGIASDPRADDEEASVTFKAPGYTADCFIKTRDGSYTVTVTSQGLVGAMNDFHRGANAGTAWAWVIDLSGILLTTVALTGLGLLYYLKKIRLAAILTFAGGTALILMLMKLAM